MDLLDKMATYVRVVEAGSFSAAKQLQISAAAVSRQIATLEAELETPLVLRSTRRMTVTPAGQRYYAGCLRILREVEDAQSAARGTGLVGVLKVSAPVTFGLTSVVPHLRTLAAKHPSLRLDVRLEDRIIDLALEGSTSRFASASSRPTRPTSSRIGCSPSTACSSRRPPTSNGAASRRPPRRSPSTTPSPTRWTTRGRAGR